MLSVVLPGCRDPRPMGILLVDSTMDELHVQLHEHLPSDDVALSAVWQLMPEELTRLAKELGGRRVLNWLLDTASHTFTLRDLATVEMEDPSETVAALYKEHVSDAAING